MRVTSMKWRGRCIAAAIGLLVGVVAQMVFG